MKVGHLRERLSAALAAAMRNRAADAVALTADRTKAMAVALAGLADDADVEIETLELSTRNAAAVLGFHPEHVRRLIRTGRLPARLERGDYHIGVDDLWPLLEARHREPGRRRIRRVPARR
jgi:hypothetical protein